MMKKKDLVFLFGIFFLIILLNFSSAQVTGNALFPDNWKGFNFSNLDGINIFKLIMFFIVWGIIYWVINPILNGKIIGKFLFSGAVAYLAVSLIAKEEISSIMSTYSALLWIFIVIFLIFIFLIIRKIIVWIFKPSKRNKQFDEQRDKSNS